MIKNIFKRNSSEGLVLMYHRIADVSVDPWDLCVSPENFEQQIRYLKQKFEFILMDHLAGRLQKKQSVKNRIAITFDDGYLDNFTVAKPILEKYKVPATFFLTGKFSQNATSYWWDELEQIILSSPVLPEIITIPVSGDLFSFFLGEDSVLTESMMKEISEWREDKPFYNNRLKMFSELSSLLKTMHPREQARLMDSIKNWAGAKTPSTPVLMNEQHIREMAAIGIFEIGAHTLNHPALGNLSDEEQYEEIRESKILFESLIEKKITGFAYPHGHFNQITPTLIKSSGFHYAVSTTEKKISLSTNLYDIPRFQVKNWNGPAFKNIMKLWK